MALSTPPSLGRLGYMRWVEHPPRCPDCDRTLRRHDESRGLCTVCGQLVVVPRWVDQRMRRGVAPRSSAAPDPGASSEPGGHPTVTVDQADADQLALF